MMRWLFPSALAAGLAACGSSELAPFVPGKMWEVSFDETASPQSIVHDGVSVTLELGPRKVDSDSVSATINASGLEGYTIELASASKDYGRTVGIGRLSANDDTPSVLIIGFTGGAHCCIVIQALKPISGKWVTVDFDWWDGDIPDTFPSDVDGDGTVDFVTGDTAFNYQFSSYAHSWAPPKIINIVGANTVDVSARPGFRQLFENFSKDALEACLEPGNIQPAGACAGYAASEARLGRGDAAFKFVIERKVAAPVDDLPEGCDVALVDSTCPPGQERKFFSFEAALVWFLSERGYLRAHS